MELIEKAKELANEKLQLQAAMDFEYEESYTDSKERENERQEEYKKDILEIENANQ